MAVNLTAADKIRYGLDWVRKRLPVAIPTVLARWQVIEDPGIKTACTNGKVLRYNPVFVDKLTLGGVASLVLHEAMHPLFGHTIRLKLDLLRRGIDVNSAAGILLRKRHNTAADLAINSIARPLYVEAGGEDLIALGIFPRAGKFAGYPEGKSMDYYLRQLEEDFPPDKPEEPAGPQPQTRPQPVTPGEDEEEEDTEGSDGDTQAGEGGEGGEEDDKEGDDVSEGGSGDEGEDEGEGEGKGEAEGKGEGEGEGDGDGEAEPVEGSKGGKGGDPTAEADSGGSVGDDAGDGEATEDGGDDDTVASGRGGDRSNKELDEILDQNVFGDMEPAAAEDYDLSKEEALANAEEEEREWRRSVAQAVVMDKNCGSGSGDAITGALQGAALVDQPDQSGWIVELRRFFTRYAPGGYTFTRLSRRHGWRQDIIMPAARAKTAGRGLLIVDTSGSMGDAECNRSLVELERVMVTYPNLTVKLVTCDTKLVEGREYTSADFPITDWEGWKGRGGTDLRPAFGYADEYRPDWIVVVTDMGWDYRNVVDLGIPTFWLGVSMGGYEPWQGPVPFGVYVEMPPALQ
jgi:predicted metal-dependent peptidase